MEIIAVKTLSLGLNPRVIPAFILLFLLIWPQKKGSKYIYILLYIFVSIS